MVNINFEFATATQIIFGSGQLEKFGSKFAIYGKRVLVVVGVGEKLVSRLFEILTEQQFHISDFHVNHEPTVEMVQQAVEIALHGKCDFVISFGGGSAIDTGKAVAALIRNRGNLMQYLEVVGEGKTLMEAPAPFVAIPTTAGTGAEVTRNAVLEVPDKKVKVSLRSPLMLPKLAIVDPLLTISVPPDITAYSGLDALTQVIEPYVSKNANPLTDGLCREGIQHAGRSLVKAYEDGNDLQARENMAVTSLFGGLALANAKLGAVHGIAGPFGGMYHAPHGAVCARLLPSVMRTNLETLRERDPSSSVIERFTDIARMLTGEHDATAEDGVLWIQQICEKFQIPPLSRYGFSAGDFPELVAKSRRASSMGGNPIKLNDQELVSILNDSI